MAEAERVEVACYAGRGKTETALVYIAVLDGMPSLQAVAFVREQRRDVARFPEL